MSQWNISDYDVLHSKVKQHVFTIRDPFTFINGVNEHNISYVDLTIEFIRQTLLNLTEKQDYLAKCHILQIMTVMLETLTGQLDKYLEGILGQLINELADKDKSSFTLVVLQNVIYQFLL